MPKEGRVRSLVIDDESGLHMLIETALKRADCDADFVRTCAEGIQKFQKTPDLYDVVITDLNQKPSGVDVVNAVGGYDPRIPVYIITGGADSALETTARQLVGERYITKPFADVLGIFKKIADDARQQRQLRYP